MNRHKIAVIAVGIMTVCSCKKDDFGQRTEWPVSGIENIDTEWFEPNLSDDTPRYSDGEILLCYSDGGVIMSRSISDPPLYRFVELTTGNELTFQYDSVNAITQFIENPILTVNGSVISLRHAKLEKVSGSTKWISMSKYDKTNIVLVVD